MISLERIRYFIASAETLSFTKAAQECFISQTAISQQIALLEKELGVALFLRGHKSTRLSEAGERLLPMAKRIWEDYSAMLLEMEQAYQKDHHLQIAYSGNLEIQILREMIPLARKYFPGIQIRARKYTLEELKEAYAEGQCAIAMTITGEIDSHESSFTEIISGKMMAAVSDRSALAHRESLSLKELRSHPLILLNASTGIKSASFVYHWARKAGFSDAAIIQTDTIEEQQLMVAADQGLTFLPEGCQAAGITLLPLSDIRLNYGISAYYRRKTPEITGCVSLMKEIADRQRGMW